MYKKRHNHVFFMITPLIIYESIGSNVNLITCTKLISRYNLIFLQIYINLRPHSRFRFDLDAMT